MLQRFQGDGRQLRLREADLRHVHPLRLRPVL